MKVLQRYIEAKGCQFARHPFFARLEQGHSAQIINVAAPAIAAWVMNYQDFLRINEARVEDASLRQLVRRHRVEESAHDAWFLEDLRVLNGGEPELRWLFGRHHMAARDAANALMAEAQRTRNDAERLSLLLVCESSGAVFFEKVERHLHDVGRTAGLKFFAGIHLEAERNHEILETQMELTLSSLTLAEEVRAEAFALVDRAFAAFHLLMDGVEEAVIKAGHGLAERYTVSAELPELSAA